MNVTVNRPRHVCVSVCVHVCVSKGGEGVFKLVTCLPHPRSLVSR